MLSGYAWLYERLIILVPHLAVTFVCGIPEYDFASILSIQVLHLNTSDPNGEDKYKHIHTSSGAVNFSCAC